MYQQSILLDLNTVFFPILHLFPALPSSKVLHQTYC